MEGYPPIQPTRGLGERRKLTFSGVRGKVLVAENGFQCLSWPIKESICIDYLYRLFECRSV